MRFVNKYVIKGLNTNNKYIFMKLMCKCMNNAYYCFVILIGVITSFLFNGYGLRVLCECMGLADSVG